MANSYNKKDKTTSRGVWIELLRNFKPYGNFAVDDYYGVSLLKKKKGGMYSIKLIHDYESNGKFSSAFEVESLQDTIKIIEILEWFAKDDELRPTVHDNSIDLDAVDSDSNEDKLNF